MQPTGLERRVQPNGAPRTVNDERRSTGFIAMSHSTVSRRDPRAPPAAAKTGQSGVHRPGKSGQ